MLNSFDEQICIALSLVKEKMINSKFNINRLEYYNMNLDKNDWNNLINYLVIENLVKSNYTHNDLRKRNEFLTDLSITSKGMEYLQRENIREYPSAKILLSVARSEYDKESQRTNTIDVKIGTLLALIAFMFPVYIGLLDVESVGSVLLNWGYIISVFCVLLLCVIALIFLLRALTLRIFQRIYLKEIIDDSSVTEDENVIETALLVPYTNAVESNREQNDERAILYNKATFLTKFTIIAGFVLIVVNKFFLS